MAKVVYENPFRDERDIEGLEIDEKDMISFGCGEMRIWAKETSSEPCIIRLPGSFPSDMKVEWEFCPYENAGASELVFACRSIGISEGYYSISYMNRSSREDRNFHLCRLLKGPGDITLTVAADPLPGYTDEDKWFKMVMVKRSGRISFSIDDLEIFSFEDEGATCGDILTGGAVCMRFDPETRAGVRDLRITWI